MSLLLTRHDVDTPQTTSVGCLMLRKPEENWPIRIGGALWTLGTTSVPEGVAQKFVVTPEEQTNSGVRVPAPPSMGSALMELRRISGLTWDQLARLLGVSRRSLHFWASGKPLNAANEERLHRLLATMRELDRGSVKENRALLLRPGEDGSIPLDLLAEGQDEQVLCLLGHGPGRWRAKPAALSAKAQRARKPLAPAARVGALQDRVHQEVGKARVPRVAKDRT